MLKNAWILDIQMTPSQNSDPALSYKVEVSYMEIYNEKVAFNFILLALQNYHDVKGARLIG